MFFEMIWENALNTFHSLSLELMNFSINLFNLTSINTFNSSLVGALFTFFQIVGTTLFGVATILAYFETAVALQQGGGNYLSTTLNVFKGFAVSLGFVTVPQQLMIFTSQLLEKMLAILQPEDYSDFATGMAKTASDSLDVIGKALSKMGQPPVWLTIIISVGFIYCVFKVSLASIKRAGILTITICVGALHIFGIPRGYSDGFSSWAKQVVAICVTQFLQSVMLVIGFCIVNSTIWFVGFGFMLAATEVPRIAGHFGLDTSIKANMTQTVYSASMAGNMIRGLGK